MLRAERIRELRKEHGYNQTHIAKAIGVAQTTYSDYENNKIRIPGSLTPKIPESLIWLIFLHKFKLLVDRTAVLCYNTIIGQEGCVVYEIKN